MRTGKDEHMGWIIKLLDEDEENTNRKLKKDTMMHVHGVGLMPTRGAVSLPATKEGAARSACEPHFINGTS